MRYPIAALILLSAVLQTGCSTFSPLRSATVPSQPVGQPTAAEQANTRYVQAGNPARLAVIWKEDILKTPGQKSIHGFTGRVYFYDSSDQLLQVDGELTIYGYDDSQTRAGEVADRVYKYPAEKMKQRYHQSELGHSYAIWVPWPKEDNFRKQVSLLPVFKTSNNQIVMGSMNRLVISGNRPPNESQVEKTVIGSKGIADRNAIYDSNAQNRITRRPVDTITVPNALGDRLARLPQNRRPSKQVLQHLTDMETAQSNPNGELYNQINVMKRQLQSEAGGDRGQQPQPSSHNFSDTSPSGVPPAANLAKPLGGQRANHVVQQLQQTAPRGRTPLKNLGTFGKPGAYR